MLFALPVGTEAYRTGWQLALDDINQDDINQKGGLLGRPLESSRETTLAVPTLRLLQREFGTGLGYRKNKIMQRNL
jgi:hypothetical protein